MTAQVDFPVVTDPNAKALVVSPQHQTPTDKALTELVVAEPATAQDRLVCKDLLKGATRADAEAKAAELLPKMMDNRQIFLAYGTAELKDVNDLYDRLFKEVDPTETGADVIVVNLRRNMREIKNKWGDPAAYEKYDKGAGFVKKLFRRGKTMFQAMLDDISSIEALLDKTARELEGKEDQLMRNVGFYDQIYDENEREIQKLIFVIGIMELIKELAAKAGSEVKVGDADAGDRGGELRAQYAAMVSNMGIKIAEYKGRLFLAWATSPQVRTMTTLNIGMGVKLNELVHVTIPTMKATIVQWRMQVQTFEAAQQAEAVAAAANEALTEFAEATKTNIPRIAESIQTPTLKPETILAMADAIDKAADGVLAAEKLGEERRAAIDQAIFKARPIFANAEAKVSTQLITQVLESATKPLDIATSVPTTEGAQ